MFLCPQVDRVALLQGVQEGGEMNGPPLPLEERQQSLRKDFIDRENTEEFGSFFFLFSFWRDAEGG